MSDNTNTSIVEAFWHEPLGVTDTDENRDVVEKAITFALTKSQDNTAELLREVEKQIAHALETERLANKQVELRGDLAAAESAVAEVRRSHKLFFRWAADHFMSRIDDHLSTQGEPT